MAGSEAHEPYPPGAVGRHGGVRRGCDGLRAVLAGQPMTPGLNPPTGAYRWPTVDIDVELLLELSRRTVQPGNQYRLGGKAPKLTADSATIRADVSNSVGRSDIRQRGNDHRVAGADS